MSAWMLEEQQMIDDARKTYRVNLDVDADLYRWLSQARIQDHLTTSDRIRALLELVRTDSALADQVSAKASELAERRLKGTA